MSDQPMTLTQACEVLRQVKFQGLDDWKPWIPQGEAMRFARSSDGPASLDESLAIETADFFVTIASIFKVTSPR